MDAVAAIAMAVFGDVRQMRKIAERPHDAHGLLGAQRAQFLFERLRGAAVVFAAKPHSGLTDRLDYLEYRVAFLLAHHVAEQPSQIADVLEERLVFVLARAAAGFRRGRAVSDTACSTVAAVPLPAALLPGFFVGLPVFTALDALSAALPLAGLSALAALLACLGLAGSAAPRLDNALDVAGAVGTTTGAPAEPLSDAVLRRAGRADPEDVTMGFLREARV